MIYEIRVYEAAEGRAQSMRDRFYNEVAKRFFPRHGIEVMGIFSSPDDEGRLTYITRFPNEQNRKQAWAALATDTDWLSVKANTEKDGALHKAQSVTVLQASADDYPLS